MVGGNHECGVGAFANLLSQATNITGQGDGFIRNCRCLAEDILVPYPQFDQAGLNANPSNSTYHSLQVQVTTYSLPFGANRRFLSAAPAWVQNIVGQWNVAGLMRWNSGSPLTITAGPSEHDMAATRREHARSTHKKARNSQSFFVSSELFCG